MNLDLTGRNALVCGSSQGIGKAVAMELAALGANITLVARNESRLKEVMMQLACEGDQSHDILAADFSDATEWKSKLENYLARSGRKFHILINNTGGPAAGPIAEAKTEEFIQAFNNHLLCNHVSALALIPAMKDAHFGRIINIISTSVKIPLHGLGVSNTIRGAVASWSKTLANEVASSAITVNNVLPGATSTERLENIINNRSSKSGRTQEMIEEEMKAEIPMKRFADPAEIARAVAFLASPAASYITGINLPVDGGRTGSL